VAKLINLFNCQAAAGRPPYSGTFTYWHSKAVQLGMGKHIQINFWGKANTCAKLGCHRQEQQSANGKEENNAKLGSSGCGHFIGESMGSWLVWEVECIVEFMDVLYQLQRRQAFYRLFQSIIEGPIPLNSKAG
jgi:hypothetical protein